MKIFVLNKTKLSIIIVLIITILILIFTLLFHEKEVFAVEFSSNAITSDKLQNKIENLMKSEEKIAYLTFDDGPNLTVTPKVLDILKNENIKATFFVIGKNVEEYPEIVKREYNEGHYIANHGYSHNNNLLYKTEESFVEEIKKTDKAISNAIGIANYYSYVFRFPNGFMAPSYKDKKKKSAVILEKMGYVYVDWNCLNNDSMKKYTPSQLLNNLKKSAKDKKALIILMHDTKDASNSSEVLEESIRYLKSEGYIFKNFYDLK